MTPEVTCPYCGNEHCTADFVDNGVGLEQCGPYSCPTCHSVQLSFSDVTAYCGLPEGISSLSADERRTCWRKGDQLEFVLSDRALRVQRELVQLKTELAEARALAEKAEAALARCMIERDRARKRIVDGGGRCRCMQRFPWVYPCACGYEAALADEPEESDG